MVKQGYIKAVTLDADTDEPCTRRGSCPHPPRFFKILNNSYILKILENKFMKNYIFPSQENYICPPQFGILILSLDAKK